MSNKFFENFPVINYKGNQIRDILLKSRIVRDVFSTIEAFHPLVIKDGWRADTVAYDYYGDSELYWIVYMSNDIVDPYYDWPLDYSEFNSFIIKKYGSIATAMSTVVFWSNPNHDYFMTNETKSLLSADLLMGWTLPVYAYDYENKINESKRNIRLLDSSYTPQIISEISKIYG